MTSNACSKRSWIEPDNWSRRLEGVGRCGEPVAWSGLVRPGLASFGAEGLGHMQGCQAKRSDGKTHCGRRAVEGSKYCHYHGGVSREQLTVDLALLAGMTRIYCDSCSTERPLLLDRLAANDRNDHDAVDLVCGDCKLIIATLHADPGSAHPYDQAEG